MKRFLTGILTVFCAIAGGPKGRLIPLPGGQVGVCP